MRRGTYTAQHCSVDTEHIFRQPQTHLRLLDNRSAQCCTPAQTAVVCPELASKAQLTAQDLAALLRIPERTAQHRMKRWREHAALGLYPRIERRARDCGGFEYVVDAESFERWMRGERIAA